MSRITRQTGRRNERHLPRGTAAQEKSWRTALHRIAEQNRILRDQVRQLAEAGHSRDEIATITGASRAAIAEWLDRRRNPPARDSA
jgi:hypothetical protein